MTLSKEARLPSRPDWTGWTKPRQNAAASTEFYDFRREVTAPKTRAPIGGGIHFGSTAVTCSAMGDVSQLVLRYGGEARQLVLSGPDGSALTLESVDARVLKALWRFVSADGGKRNMAISIGWTGVEGTLMSSTEEAVLIDPFLVDTAVGRDLFLADSIPWALDQAELPNRRTNPTHPAFAERQRARQARRTQKLEALTKQISGTAKIGANTGPVSTQLGFPKSTNNRREALMIAVLDADRPEGRADVMRRVTELDGMQARIGPLETRLQRLELSQLPGSLGPLLESIYQNKGAKETVELFKQLPQDEDERLALTRTIRSCRLANQVN